MSSPGYPRQLIELSKIHDRIPASHYFPHPRSLWMEQLAIRLGCKKPQPSRWLSRMERDAKPFSLREKGGDEGKRLS